MSSITPRDRILTTLNHERPDRIPTDGWFHPEVIERLKQHYRTEDWASVLDQLGIEGWAGGSPTVRFAAFEKRCPPAEPGAEQASVIQHADGVYEDVWGIRWRRGKNDRYEEWLDGPLAEAAGAGDVEKYPFPTPADVTEPPDYSDRIAQFQRDGMFVSGGIENPFKRHWHLRGYENGLMDYMDDREVLGAIHDRLYALTNELGERMARGGVDMIKVVGDVAMQDRTIIRPDDWRAVDKPRWAEFIARCKAIKPDLYFFFHSDGNLTDLVDDLVEIGFNVINPIQPECMDPRAVKRRWGDRITLHGCISIQQTLPFGTVDDVRREVDGLIRDCGSDGGLVLMPSNVLQPDTSTENIIACYHAARDYRWQ